GCCRAFSQSRVSSPWGEYGMLPPCRKGETPTGSVRTSPGTRADTPLSADGSTAPLRQGAAEAVQAAGVSTMSRWMPPQRVQRMVQYSQPPRPARPGMIFSTVKPPLHSGQAETTGWTALGSASMRGMGRSLAAQPGPVDVVLGVGDGSFRIVPGKTDIERGKGNAVDHD